MATVTTTFRPDPTCYAPSNLWLDVRPEGWGCNTYYPPFAPRPTEILPPLTCVQTELGRPGNGNWDDLCHQYNWISTGATIYTNTAYSACPEGMTGAATSTYPQSEDGGIILVITMCCPTAYDFGTVNATPTPIPSVIDGTTYPVTHSTFQYPDCKAASIKELLGKKVTFTVSSSRTVTTTEVAWDYENGFILATGATIYKRLYPNPRAGTTGTCFGDHSGCESRTNPYRPRPTRAPADTYVPPPSPEVTQFTPSPSCLSESNLWLVSGKCSANTTPISPPWLQCTTIVAGDPNELETACYQGGRSTVVSGTPSYYTACPVGYIAANSTIRKPFDSTTRSTTQTYEVEASAFTCCPSAFGDITFTYTTMLENLWSKTVHDGVTLTVTRHPLPRCFASRVAQLGNKDVTMGMYSDTGGWDNEKKPGQKFDGTTEAVWDEAQNTLFAHAQFVSWTVFHGTHTCFENCGEYFTYSYSNTQRSNVPPSTATTTAGTQEEGAGSPSSSSSAGAAAAMARGDVQAGLSVVVVVVTIIHVAIQAFV